MGLNNKVVSFVYDGGRQAGERRYVLVAKEDDRHIEGFDLERRGYRAFFKKTIKGNVTECPFKLIDTAAFPNSVKPKVVVELTNGLKSEGFDRLVANGETLVAFKPVPALNLSTTWKTIKISTSKGEVSFDTTTNVLRNGARVNAAATINDLIDALKEIA